MTKPEILGYGTGDRAFDELVDWFKRGRPDPADKPGQEKIVKEENQREYREEREEWGKTGDKKRR